MNNRQRFRFKWHKITHAILDRLPIVVTAIALALVVLLVWFLVLGVSRESNLAAVAISVVATFFASISALANLILAAEARSQRQKEERPQILAYFEGRGTGTINFAFENIGNAPAKDLTFDFDPAPIDHAGRKLDSISLFANPITFFPPDQKIRQIVDSGPRFFENGNPTEFEVTARYYSVSGKPFSDTVIHDLEYLKQATLPEKTIEENLLEISREIKAIKRVLESVRGTNSIVVERRDDYLSRLGSTRNDTGVFGVLARLFSLYRRLVS